MSRSTVYRELLLDMKRHQELIVNVDGPTDAMSLRNAIQHVQRENEAKGFGQISVRYRTKTLSATSIEVTRVS